MKTDALKVHVFGKNKLNEFIVLYLAQIVPQVKTYIGKKVFLASGKMSANFNIEIKDIPTQPSEENFFLTIHRNGVYVKYEKLVFSFSISLNNGGGGVYFDREVWLADIDKNGVAQPLKMSETLEEIVESYGFDKRMDFEVEKAAILAYQDKVKELDAAKSKVKALDFLNHRF